MQHTVDYIIVGQGLAGSAVAVQLLKRDKKILVIDHPAAQTSSRIAAGLFNPITGKKMVKTWMSDTLFPYLHNYYREIEKQTEKKFFFPMPLYRPFLSIEEQNEWMGRSIDPSYEPYLERIFTNPVYPEVKNPFGGMMLKQCGYLNTTSYVEAVRDWIRQSGIFREENFLEGELIVSEDSVQYKDIQAAGIIYCQGWNTGQSKWFGALPVRPLKGETVTIKTTWQKDVILNRGVYVVPGGGPGLWKVGATYGFQDHTEGVTPVARTELVEGLSELVDFAIEIVAQDWGIRPTTPDRRPMLGAHPKSKRLMVFNGLGTKGVSLAP
ncbi:MAG: NAD(P)/FAD-dependent oxidoreductase, partial [Bacteroidota bacterium]